ncbi:MAG: tyrosine-type recombinase/integrase [Bacteroidales bacterium]|nr:tyrosine-type recombinase/integrase [Bacteroidales bacterium]
MVVQGFIDYIKLQKRYSPRTVELYGNALDEYFALHSVNASDVTNDMANELLTPLLIRSFIAENMERGIGGRTVNMKLSALSSFCNYLVRNGILNSNPVRKVTRPKTEKKLPRFYTEEAMQHYFDIRQHDFEGEESYKHLRSRMIVLILYSTGMRRAELCNLKIKDFDQHRQVFRITGKGDKEREIPVPSLICEYILLYLDRIKNGTERTALADDYFFVTDKCTQLYLGFVNNAVKEQLAGIEGFTGKKSPHVLRHSIATHLLNNGAGLNSIKEVLGHSSLAATQVYTHNSFEQLKKTYLTAHPRAKK